MLPNFLIIGAQKSGTSSLAEYLRGHPQVFVTEAYRSERGALRSEPAFFTENWWRGQRWYEEKFERAESARARGEGTPGYTMYPRFKDVPKRIAGTVPDVKLVYVVRQPVRRMQSHYNHRVLGGAERAGIETALREDSIYLATSRYALQIEQYLEYFSREQLLVILSEDLRHARRAVLRRVYDFLDVDPDWWSPSLEREFNVSVQRKEQRPLLKRALSRRAAARVADRTPPWIKERLKEAGVTHPDPPAPDLTISAELERELEDRLRGDVRRLREYLPAGFDGWGIA